MPTWETCPSDAMCIKSLSENGDWRPYVVVDVGCRYEILGACPPFRTDSKCRRGRQACVFNLKLFATDKDVLSCQSHGCDCCC